MRRRFIALSLSLAGLVAVSACSSSSGTEAGNAPSANQSASQSASSASSPSPSSDAPPGMVDVNGVQIPGAAAEDSMDGAKTYASLWVSALNDATTTGNTSTLRALAKPSCGMCTDFANQLDKIYGAGGHVESTGWDLQSEVPIAGQPANNPGIQLNFKVGPQKVYRSKGSKPQSYAGGDQRLRMFLIREGDHWLVQRMTI